MARDLSPQLKAEVVRFLSAAPEVTQLVPAERIYAMTPPAMPTWPFIRYGSPTPAPYEASCWDGMSSRITIHAFAESTAPGVRPARSGEDWALEIGAAVVTAMERFEARPESGIAIVSCEWAGSRCIREGVDADRWHAIVDFTVVAIVS